MKYKLNIKNIPKYLSYVLLIYIFICALTVTFSFVMIIIFILMSILLYLLSYCLNHPYDYKKESPKFFNVFIETISILIFSFFSIVILINTIYPIQYIDNNKNFDYIIVFGAGVSTDESKNIIINTRILTALKYSDENNRTKFVLSGAKGDNEFIEEAFYMRNYMLSSGVPNDRILVDIFSNNTYENINNSLYIIKEDMINRNRRESIFGRPFKKDMDFFIYDNVEIGFLSNEFHLMRIDMMAKLKGVKKPINIVVKTTPFYLLYYEIREVLSIMKAFVLFQLKIV